MYKASIVIVLAAGASQAKAEATHCADASARLSYAESTYDGGAPPPPFLVTETEEASVGGASLGKNEYSQQDGWKRAFAANFVDGTRVELGTVADRAANVTRTTYAVRLSLSPLPQGPLAFDGLVICEESHWIIPPP